MSAEAPTGRSRIAPAYLALAASLYALQGVVVAYLFNFNKQYMIASGVPEDKVSWVQTLALAPLVLKFLAGPVSDRWSLLGLGHRRPYLVVGLLVQGGALAGLAMVDAGGHLGAFAALAVLAVAGLGLYDTTCDGLVVDATPPGDRDRVQGILWGARALAAMICTAGFGAWLQALGGPAAADRLLWACVALGVPPLVLAIALRDPRRAADAEAFDWSALRVMVRPRSLAILAFGGIYGMLAIGVEANLGLYYATIGFAPDRDVGALGAARYFGRAVGSMAMPIAAIRLGRGRALAVGIVGLAIGLAGQAAIGGGWSAALWGIGFGAAVGWCDAAFAAAAMAAADPRLAASTFALFMAITNLSVAGDAAVAESVRANGGGYRRVFVAAGVACLALLGLVRPIVRPVDQPSSVEDRE